MMVRVGELVEPLRGGRLRIRLEGAGFAVIELPTAGLDLQTFTEFLVPVSQQSPVDRVSLFWWQTLGEDLKAQPLTVDDAGEHRVSMRSNEEWPASIPAVALRFEGTPNADIEIGPIAVFSASYTNPLSELVRAAYYPEPWTLASINVFRLERARAGGLYLIEWVGLGVVSLGIVLLILTRVSHHLLKHAGTLFLTTAIIAWLLLDSVWLRQLYARGSLTYDQFAGQSDAEKLSRSIDAFEVGITRQLQALIGEGARVFVATAGDKVGNRLAYYLYPHNVYWRRGGPELPDAQALRSGDYVVVVPPTRLQLSPDGNRLRLPGGGIIAVEALVQESWGSLFEVRQ